MNETPDVREVFKEWNFLVNKVYDKKGSLHTSFSQDQATRYELFEINGWS